MNPGGSTDRIAGAWLGPGYAYWFRIPNTREVDSAGVDYSASSQFRLARIDVLFSPAESAGTEAALFGIR
jgi:hypothetical protein